MFPLVILDGILGSVDREHAVHLNELGLSGGKFFLCAYSVIVIVPPSRLFKPVEFKAGYVLGIPTVSHSLIFISIIWRIWSGIAHLIPKKYMSQSMRSLPLLLLRACCILLISTEIGYSEVTLHALALVGARKSSKM
ncbi:hypothetical protein F4680DRAFT_206153 [Xylaria scruposa]|nr:hypothetical protein F4680DRAFT_206153 [Xylaria scruposa]